MTLEDLRGTLWIRPWNVLYWYLYAKQTTKPTLRDLRKAFDFDNDEAMLAIPMIGPELLRQIRAAVHAYETRDRNHPLLTEP